MTERELRIELERLGSQNSSYALRKIIEYVIKLIRKGVKLDEE